MSNLTSKERDYLAEFEEANKPARALLIDAGRYINYLRTVVRDMLPYFPKHDPRHVGFSEAAEGLEPAPETTEVQELRRQLEEARVILHDNMALANRTSRNLQRERDAMIRTLRKTYSAIEIADMVGLTRQRVHQILNEAPVPSEADLRAEKTKANPLPTDLEALVIMLTACRPYVVRCDRSAEDQHPRQLIRQIDAALDWVRLRTAPQTGGELERLRRLQDVANALDDAVAEFGLQNAGRIAEAYQQFHDVLHDGHGAQSAPDVTSSQPRAPEVCGCPYGQCTCDDGSASPRPGEPHG